MANKVKLTPAGQAVKAHLAVYLNPKLAADGKLKAGELNELLHSIKPAKTFKEQQPQLVTAIHSAFDKRLAKDASLEDLPEILEALKAAEGEEEEGLEEDKLPKDDDMSEDEDAPGPKLVKMLTNPEYAIPPEDLELMNGLINALCPAEGADAKKPKFPAKPEEAAMPKPELTPQAMDAALKANTKSIAERFAAAEECKPIIGTVAPLSFDSASDIFKMALEAKGVETKDIHPGAFQSLLKSLNKPAEVVMAQDASGLAALEKKYSTAPAVL